MRFHVDDPELALTLAAGALLSLNRLLHDQPERDDAQATDRLVENLLRVYGLPADEAQEICRRPLPDLMSSQSKGANPSHGPVFATTSRIRRIGSACADTSHIPTTI